MILALAVLWAALNAVDLAETLYALSIGHVEQNPIAAALIELAGPLSLVGYKLVLTGVGLWAVHAVYLKRPGLALGLLWAGAALVGYAVVHNARVLGGIQ